MRKVPVLEVIKYAYRFLFGEFGTIVRLTWFPLLVIAIVGYAVGYQTIEAQVSSGDFAQPSLNQLILSLIGWVVSAAGYAMVAVALHRVILFNDRKHGTFLLFSFKRTEWLFVAFGLLAIVAIFVAVIFVAGFGLGTGVAEASPSFFGIIIVVLTLGGMYLYVRLWPLYPVMAVEKQLNFKRAFDLSRGNFWRLFGVSILGVLPLVVVILAIQSIVASPMTAIAQEAAQAGNVRAFGDALQSLNTLNSVAMYFFSIIGTGLSIPLICYAYKALRNIGAFEYLDEATGSVPPAGAGPNDRYLE
ncbi:MAG: hypothetical protein GY798_10745 [Hyphomicrobiales bacterium]|nr:hypothetical protein [Hyphomicrobiales bacterium]